MDFDVATLLRYCGHLADMRLGTQRMKAEVIVDLDVERLSVEGFQRDDVVSITDDTFCVGDIGIFQRDGCDVVVELEMVRKRG